jgi:phosphate-selective porin OprO/OprP
LLAQGWLFDRRLEYAFGGFDGRLTGVADNNNTRDGVVYVNLRPFLLDEDSPWRYLNIGGSAFSGSQIAPQDPLPMRTSLQSSENDEAASSASAVFLDFEESVTALGSRSAGALHIAWYRGPFSLESEVQAGRFQFLPHHGERRVGVPVLGYHIAGSWFLTGEEVSERMIVVPLRPFDLRPGSRGPGAFEVFARFSHLLLGEQVFTGELADPNRWTRRVDMPEVGFNWYPNRFIKLYVDWQLPIYGSPVATDPSGRRTTRNGNMFWIRAQVYF